MSIRAFVNDPQTESEKSFRIGISTEAFYNTTILPIAERHSLDLCEEWGVMTIINSSNIEEFIRQIGVITAELSRPQGAAQLNEIYMDDKLSNLPGEFKTILNNRPDATIIIG